MRSAAMMLTYLGEREASRRLNHAIEQAYAEQDHLTTDVGGHSTTTEFTNAVIARLQS
jgi:isocitrate/isopropylmalate dehydrogenase